ncbi:MAG: DUF4412 domain-containing protein [Polyangiaceae bacterium]
MTCVRWLVLAFAALPLAGCKAETAESFEGEVDILTTTDSGGDATIRYFIKGERVRMESSAEQHKTTQIMDISTNDVFVLDDTRKTYRTTNDPPAVHAVHHALFAAPGRRDVIAEAKRVEKMKEPATLFEVPSSYALVR